MLKIMTALYGDLFIIPFPVNGSATETLEFSTDVLPCYTAEAEARTQVRAIPRQTFDYSYSIPYLRMMQIFNAVYAGLRAKWAVPQWFEAQPVIVTPGQSVFACDTTVHDVRSDALVLVYGAGGLWDVLQVTSVAADSVTTASGTTLTGLTYLVPVRVGYISGQGPMKPAGHRNSLKLTFQVEDVLTGLTDTAPSYNGLDLYTDPYIIDTEGAGTVTRQDDQVEYVLGDIARNTPWKNTYYPKTYNYAGFSVAELRAFKNFFYRRAGKFRAFMSPSFESNLRKASTGNVVSTFKVYDDGYLTLLSAAKKDLAFCLMDDTWQMRKLLSAVDLGGGVTQLNLDSALNVDASRIKQVSFAGVNRLDTDRMQISLKPAGYSSAAFQVVEIGQ